MYSSSKSTSLLIVLLAMITQIGQSNAVCCNPGWVAYECDEFFGKCRETMCRDGSRANGEFCGVGQCNYIGCDCEGGCLTNSMGGDWMEAERIFAENYGKETIPLRWSSRPRYKK